MKRKPKGETIELLYTSSTETNKKAKSNSKKSRKTKKTISEKNKAINLDNEIIIGLTPKKKENTSKNTARQKNKTNKNSNSKKLKQETKRKKTSNTSKTSKTKKQEKKKKTGLKIFKWTSIFILIITAITFFMMSSVFNINKIVVSNNSKISSEEIIRLSGLTTGINMFKTSNSTIRNRVKSNPYIENVKIKRGLRGTVELEVEERVPTYMLKFANAHVYINNQGYMLEIAETPLELPTITGFETPSESIKEGNRLVTQDLQKLEDVIKIIDSAKNNSLANIITEVNISDSTNYILTIASESKTVQFGDISNVNVKLLKIEAVIEQEKGISGEIYFQGSEKTVFKEETKR